MLIKNGFPRWHYPQFDFEIKCGRRALDFKFSALFWLTLVEAPLREFKIGNISEGKNEINFSTLFFLIL